MQFVVETDLRGSSLAGVSMHVFNWPRHFLCACMTKDILEGLISQKK